MVNPSTQTRAWCLHAKSGQTRRQPKVANVNPRMLPVVLSKTEDVIFRYAFFTSGGMLVVSSNDVQHPLGSTEQRPSEVRFFVDSKPSIHRYC